MEKQELAKKLQEFKIRSAWMRGVVTVAEMIIENIETEEVKTEEIATIAKCGAGTLKEAIYGGCYLVYDQDIAKTFCNKTELKITKNGLRYPNAKKNWLDVHLRGLTQAVRLLESLIN